MTNRQHISQETHLLYSVLHKIPRNKKFVPSRKRPNIRIRPIQYAPGATNFIIEKKDKSFYQRPWLPDKEFRPRFH